MGHWTTYRRRGSPPSAADVLPLPTTPVLSIPGSIFSTSAAAGNTGGLAQLWKSATEFGTYTLDTSVAWVQVTNFGVPGARSGSWLKSLNVGDGIHRSNQSPFSNALLAP